MKKVTFSFLSILLIGAFIFPQGAQALSALQIESILGLLRAFDADSSTVNAVSNTLQGNTGVSTSSIEYKDTLQLSRNLSRGMKGSDIERLQRYLRSTGDYKEDITGYYGVRTEEAVKSWQSRTGVVRGGTPSTTGYGNVGPSTRTALTNAARTAVVVTPDIPDETRGVDTFIPETPQLPDETGGVETGNIDAGAKFAASPTLGGAPLTVTFSTNLEQFSGLQGGGSIQLDYGDGNVIVLCKPGVSGVSACTQEWSYPTYTYRQGGTYNTKLLRQPESGSSSVLGTVSITVGTFTIPDETKGVDFYTPPTSVEGDIEGIKKQFEIHEWVPIIVTVANGGAISSSVDDVVNSLSSVDFELKHKFSYPPGFAGSVTESGLSKLLQNPLVARIDLDGVSGINPPNGPEPKGTDLPLIPDETKGVDFYTPPTPNIATFSAQPAKIEKGQQTKLSWRVENAISCSLTEPRAEVERNIRPLDLVFDEDEVYPAIHSIAAAPQDTAVYTITCLGSGGQTTKNLTVQVVPVTTIDQKAVMHGENIYSADLVIDSGKTWMYFGGWLNQGQVHDDIYRAECNAAGTSCSNLQTVISSEKNGFEHLNDPSIVRMPGDYYIMYMTGVEAGGDGLDAPQNHIYFSTSWVGDGIHWSKPQLLIKNHWLPSGVFEENGTVSVYANDNISHGKVVRLNMGPSGVGFQESTRVDYGTEDTHFNNVDVVRDGSGYAIVAERPTFPGSAIDMFSSADGVNWQRTYKGVLETASGQNRIGTPTFHPTNTRSIFFGSTAKSDSTGFKIYQADVSRRVGSTHSGSFLSALSSAFKKATASVADSFLFLFGN